MSASRRLSQQERRDATQAALLQATLDCLIEDGYVLTTTRLVAKRAGVSQGALQYHYSTRSELIVAAIQHLAHQLAELGKAEFPATHETGSERDQCEHYLDFLWEVHNLPIAGAVQELFVAARTDADVAARMGQVLAEAVDLVVEGARRAAPTLSANPRFREWLLLSVATMRGAVTVSALSASTAHVGDWAVLRRHLMTVLDFLEQ
ncbi:TetR/AcrR family transcriptional regulator [Hoyosella sp. YIM 151337]|uniref:TetR/AcrR family transcriptional regulator n=1 Tax=Hoyosella sp. YIM 151337 TaxID=2992742 RepID=UPI002235BFC0|nr:TetR/AcrR family transcriptional regulator [Hoyosella sp. YIM 151337]MCW4353514.1 TetR/AcrR family transcriptional regulator [Hoyosella sp. YIM 151337]